MRSKKFVLFVLFGITFALGAATNQQVQQWSNERTRVRAEQFRALKIACEDDRASFDEIYANLTNSPDWTDNRTDGPPKLLAPSDLLAMNTLQASFLAWMDPNTDWEDPGTLSLLQSGGQQWATVVDACVRPVNP